MKLNKIKKNEFFLIFIIGTLLAFAVILYKFFFLEILVNKNYESGDYIRPAISLLNGHSFTNFLENLNQRLPLYPLLISLIFKIFGQENFLAVLITNSLIFGLISGILIKIKNLFTKKLYWVSVALIVFNLNILWSATIILPDILFVFFLSCGVYFFLKYIKVSDNFFDLLFSLIFFGFAYTTKPIVLYLPFFLSFYLVLFYFFYKKIFNIKSVIISITPILISILIASPIYLFNYKNSGKLNLTNHEGRHLLFDVYPCLINEYGCGARGDISAKKKVLELSKKRINEFYKNNEVQNFNKVVRNKFIESEIYKEIFYELVNETDKSQIIKSSFFSYLKLMLHTSIISVLQVHKKSYEDYRISIKNFTSNYSIHTFLWLLFQVSLILLRFLQIFGLFSLLKNEKKNVWVGIFLIFFIISLIFPAIGLGNFRYRLPIEPILILLSIIGVKNLNMFRKKKPAVTYSPKS